MARDARSLRIIWTVAGGPGTKPEEDGPRTTQPTGHLREVRRNAA